MYRCETLSESGFVQQLVLYLTQGYWFYVTGSVPDRKDPRAVDAKLIERYGLYISKWSRARRKRAGHANMQYLRHGRFFVLLATRGEHRFFQEEKYYRDVRRDSISFAGYSIGYKNGADGKWHGSVRIHPSAYRELKAKIMEEATRRSADLLTRDLLAIRFESYAPVRRQILNLLRSINRTRSEAALETLPVESLRLARRPVKPFGACYERTT